MPGRETFLAVELLPFGVTCPLGGGVGVVEGAVTGGDGDQGGTAEMVQDGAALTDAIAVAQITGFGGLGE